MNTKDFIRLGIPLGEATRRATEFISKFILAGGDKTRLEEEVKAIIANPSAFTEDSLRGDFAKAPATDLSKPWPGLADGTSSGGRGPGSDFRREFLNLSLQAAHLLQRPLRENRE